MPNQKKISSILPIGYTACAIGLVVFAFLDLGTYDYYASLKPLAQSWANDLTYAMILAGAIFAAVTGTLLSLQFGPKEPPRRIWLFFTLGWWCWVLGEVGGFVTRAIYEEVPAITFNDLFWVIGYTCFAIALFLQFRLIYGRGRKIGRVHFGLIMLAILVVTAIVTYLAHSMGSGITESWSALYLDIFYPVCDVIIGVAAVWLAFLFGRGMWARPWWGLIAFFFADGIYVWYGNGGYDFLGTILTEARLAFVDTWLSVFTDTLYTGGYVIVGMAFLTNFLIQKYGPLSVKKKVG